MKIKICCSSTMTSRGEYDIIRLPKSIRDAIGVSPQSIISVKTGSKILRLRVRKIFKEDVDTGVNNAYVTQDNFELLNTRSSKTSIVDVTPFEGLSLGCDPEFFLINKRHGNIQVASIIMGDKLNTPLGLRVGKHGYLGNDGGSILAEIRPDPVVFKEQNLLIRNIAELIGALKKNRVINPKTTRPEAHSYYNGVAAGFHLHFGLSDTYVTGKGIVEKEEDEFEDTSDLNEDERKKILPSLLVKALDYHLGFLMLHLDPEYQERSWKSEYGRAGDFRSCKYTIEYRVPGGYFLGTPQLTSGLIATAALIVSNTVPLLGKLTDGYKKKLVLDRASLEKQMNSYFNVPNTMKIKSILDGEESVSDLEMNTIFGNVLRNIEAMSGHNEKTKWFTAQAVERKGALDKTKTTANFIVSARPRKLDLIETWRI